jgi:small subunit ribosomal protein S8
MSMTDPIADLLTRIRNAQRAGLEKVELPSSKLKLKLAELLKSEGFIGPVAVRPDGRQGILSLTLKYDEQKNPVISEIRRQSTPIFPR